MLKRIVYTSSGDASSRKTILVQTKTLKGGLELGAKNVIPDLGSDTEAELEVFVVVFEVVLFHLPHVLWEFCVVEGVMHAVVDDVHGEGAADDAVGDGVWEQGMCELGKRVAEHEEEQRRHDESKPVHGQEVVDAVKEEVEREERGLVRKDVVDVEEEAVNRILEQRPDDDTDCPADGSLGHGDRPHGSVKLRRLGSSFVPVGGVERRAR